MSKPKFSPGPWHINTASGVQIFPATGASVCELNILEAKEENLANAALIAAAPELYAALDALVNPEEGISVKGVNQRFEEAKAILAKARGEWTAEQILEREG
ncbi:MAG: hypothetical protein KF698_08415 [Anaerolineales bacterium]|nr:hypothetical protein [Anaerolineales bacterium]